MNKIEKFVRQSTELAIRPMNSATRGVAALLLSFLLAHISFAQEKSTSLSAARDAIEANMRTPEGKAYDEKLGKEFLQKHTETFRQCKLSSGESSSFWLLLKVDKDGAVREVLLSPTTKLGSCARERLLKSSFLSPPKPDYWVGIFMQFRH